MFKDFGKFKNFLILLLVFSFVFSFVGVVFGETVTKDIREDLEKRSIYELVIAGRRVGDIDTDYTKLYVEPEGVIISIAIRYLYQYQGITQENLNSFFASLWKVFGTSKYPPNTRINFYIQIEPTDSLIVEFPIGTLYDFYKEKISRGDFLKQCDIWINGEKATIEGDTIKALGKELFRQGDNLKERH
jgi:hypothetical protein